MTTSRATNPENIRQCCTCANWMPMRGDEEFGRCLMRKKGTFEATTGWSDGCDKWETNKTEAKSV